MSRTCPNRAGFLAAAIAAGVLTATSTPAVAADRATVCAALGDVIRVAVDQIVTGNQSARLTTALEAHERLECPVNTLLDALRVPSLDDEAAGEGSYPKRDSDRRQN
jgi:hypothetical protein